MQLKRSISLNRAIILIPSIPFISIRENLLQILEFTVSLLKFVEISLFGAIKTSLTERISLIID